MKMVGRRRSKGKISLDISDRSDNEIDDFFKNLPIKSLKQWLVYYEGKNNKKVYDIIRDYIDLKSK